MRPLYMRLLLWIILALCKTTTSLPFQEGTLFENIQQGKFRFWQKSDCLNILHQQSPFPFNEGCYFENPDAPYGLIMLPPHKNETFDEYYGYPVSDGNLSATWHLQPHEAIVLIGRTPPNCTYFGFTNYLYSRWNPKDWTPETPYNLWNCPSGGQRCEIFASLDDSINMNRGMNLEPEQFNTTFAVVFSPSIEAMDAAITTIQKSGVKPTSISNFSFPGAKLNLGIDTYADTFITLMRNAFFQETADDYINSVPLFVYRLELFQKNVTLFERRPLVKRATNKTDASIANISMHEMRTVLKSLVANVTSYYSTSKSMIQQTNTKSKIPDNGFECIERGTICLADCRDTYYPFSLEMYRRAMLCQHNESKCYKLMNATLTDTDNDTIIVVGVNHAMTNMSSYSSISIYDAKYLWGVYAVGNEQLAYTAKPYMHQSSLMKYFYVYTFRRDCGTTPNCYSIPSNPSLDAFIPLENPIAITERSYDNPITHVGPNPSDIIMPVVIHIKKRY